VEETTGRKTKAELEKEIGEGMGEGTGIETRVGVGTDLETGVVIEGLDIMADMREDDYLNMYSVLYSLIHLVLLNLL